VRSSACLASSPGLEPAANRSPIEHESVALDTDGTHSGIRLHFIDEPVLIPELNFGVNQVWLLGAPEQSVAVIVNAGSESAMPVNLR